MTLNRLTRSFSHVDKHRIYEVNSENLEFELREINYTQSWNPPKFNSSEVYEKLRVSLFHHKILLK